MKSGCAVSDCENKCGQWQSPLCFHFYLGDSHVASLLGMTFGAIAITAMPFEQCSAFAFSPPCGSCSVFEVAHSVNKYALKEYPFGCGCPTLVIPRERGDRGNLAVRRTHQADNFAVIYIISFPGDVSTSLNMTIRCGCPTRVIQSVSVGIQPSGAHTKQTILRNCGRSFCPCSN